MRVSIRFGVRVRVQLPGEPAFFGRVYHVECRRRRERLVYVEKDSGCGVAVLVRYVELEYRGPPSKSDQ